jgi:hypothetical protein
VQVGIAEVLTGRPLDSAREATRRSKPPAAAAIRRLATAVQLEPDLDPITLDEVLPVRLARSHRPI